MLPDEYGCIVGNRFGQLSDDEADPFDLINEAVIEKEKNKIKGDLKKPKHKKLAQRETQKNRRVQSLSNASGDALPGLKHPAKSKPAQKECQGAEEAERKSGFGELRNNKEYQPLEFSIPRPISDADRISRVRGGVRGGRGREDRGYFRSTEMFNPRGKREYERHSGSGVSPEEKRGGRGPWNWGSVQYFAGDVMDVTPEGSVQHGEAQQPMEEEGDNQASEVDGEMVVQVAMEMSLDEWKALQELSRSKAALNLRKTDGKVPSKARVIHESKHLEKAESVEEVEDGSYFLRRSVNDITSSLDINFGSLPRPSRGGRGRGQGGRGGSNSLMEREPIPKLERVDALAPNPDDPEDFPALAGGT